MIDTFFLTNNPDKITEDVRILTLWFVVLGCITLVASFLEVAMFMWSGARQVSRLRERYLRACLNQEQAYYDTIATSGNVLSGLNEDCQAVQNAIGEKVGNVIHHVGTFLVSIGISLWKGWKLALVMLALTPLIGLAGAVLAKIIGLGEEKMGDGYAKANVQSTQAITNIRTVASFRAEPRIFEKYTQLLQEPTRVQTQISTMGGLAGGFVNCVIFFTFAAPCFVSNVLCCAAVSWGLTRARKWGQGIFLLSSYFPMHMQCAHQLPISNLQCKCWTVVSLMSCHTLTSEAHTFTLASVFS